MEDLIPVGFRFYPTEEELLSFYLRHKLDGTRPELDRVIPLVDIYAVEPWDLPRMAGERCSGETEQWFFFMPQQEREARGGKPNRTTVTGYWKATGSPGYVYSSSQKRVIGVKKTMVFYKGRAPTGRKTKWKMNEYKSIHSTPPLNLPSSSTNATNTIPKLRHEMSVCRVYITSGSSRAFDRRPSAIIIRDQMHEAPGGPPSPAAPAPAPENTSSISISGSSNSDRQMDGGVGSCTTNNFDNEIISGLEPLWEWDQLNWP